MTEARGKSEILSETAKGHCIDVFVSWKYGRREEIQSKFLDKGNAREEDAITLVSRINLYVRDDGSNFGFADKPKSRLCLHYSIRASGFVSIRLQSVHSVGAAFRAIQNYFSK